jgi:CRISPR-associated endonuclease/helicase Cas3
LQRERAAFNFANVGSVFQLIEDGWSFPVVVPWPFSGESAGEGRRRADQFRDDEDPQNKRFNSRALQPYIVAIPRQCAKELENQGIIEIVDESLGLPTSLFDEQFYSDEFGLYFDEDTYTNPASLMG